MYKNSKAKMQIDSKNSNESIQGPHEEMPSDYEEYASNLEIETTMNKFTNSEIKENQNLNLNSTPHNRKESIDSQRNPQINDLNQTNKNNENAVLDLKESEKSNYDVHKLRQKIQEQAARLQKLEQYKFICENRILQLDPKHPLPVQENHLKNYFKDSKGFNNNNIKNESDIFNSINNNYNQNKNTINNKDYEARESLLLLDEIKLLNQKLQILTEELKSTKNENFFLKEQIKSKYNSPNNFTFAVKAAFPLPSDKIQSEEALKENYKHLFFAYNEYLAEKEQILETLKIETINSEEQKNYIEILKQTIDAFILKNGFVNALGQIKKDFYGKSLHNSAALSNVDFLTEITQLRLEAEKNKKELVLSQALINELKREIDFLSKNNSCMVSTKDKILENLENGIKELDQAKNKLKAIESENAILKKEIEIFRKTVANLQDELKFSGDLAHNLQNEKEDFEKKLAEAQKHLENSQTMQNKIFDYKKSFDQIYIELNEALNHKKLLEAELLKIKSELEKQIFENAKIKEEFNLIDLERNNFLNEKDNCYKQINLLEKINKEMENCQKAKETYKHYDCEDSRYQNLMEEFEEFKINSAKTIENLQKKLDDNNSELLNSNSIKKAAYEKTMENSLNNNYTIDYNEFKAIEEENLFLKNKINLLERELANKNELLQRIDERYEKLFFEFNQLENMAKQCHEEKENSLQEIIYWKKKYDSDLMKKINEIQNLNKDLSNYQKDLIEKQETINKLKKTLSLADEKSYNLAERLKKIENERLNKEDCKSKLDLIKKELDEISQENRELRIKLDVKSIQLEELDQKQNFYEDDLNQKDKEKYKLHFHAKALEKELEENQQLVKRYENKIDELNDEINSIYNKNKELTEKANALLSSNNNLSRENNLASSEIDYLKTENLKCLEELRALKNFDSEIQAKLSNLKSAKSEIENCINSILLIIKAYALKFEVANNLKNTFEKTFAEKIKSFLSFCNNKKHKTEKEDSHVITNLKAIEDWVKSSCFQIEKAEQKINLSNEIIEESANKIKRLEKNLNEMSFYEEEKLNSQKNLSLRIKQLEEEKKLMLQEKQNLQSELDSIAKEFNHLKLGAKTKIEELGDSTQQINELRFENEKLKNEIFKKDKINLNSSFQEKALEERIKILLKEKKYFESLLSKLASVHPLKQISRVVNDVMNVCDLISALERDKIKIVNNLNNIGYESSQLKSEIDPNVSKSLKFEKEDNLKILNEYNRKIESKKDELNKLEAEMLLSQVNQLSSADKTHSSELKIDQLTADLNQAKIEIKKLKNKLFLKEKENQESKTSLRNFRTNQSYAENTNVNQFECRTPDKTSFNRQILQNNKSSNSFFKQQLERTRDNFETNTVVNRKSFDLYNLKPIGILKSDNKGLNNLDEGMLEFYRP